MFHCILSVLILPGKVDLLSEEQSSSPLFSPTKIHKPRHSYFVIFKFCTFWQNGTQENIYLCHFKDI